MTGIGLVFLACAVLSLGASAVLIVRIERLGHRFGVSEAILGLTAAIAADAPEITSAATALVRGQGDVGVGVILGANVFQLAALLGLGAVIAGGIRLDRRVVAFEGVVALWLAVVALGVVAGGVGPPAGLVLALIAFIPYVVVAGMSPERRARLPLPRRLRRDVDVALEEESDEIEQVVDDLLDDTGGRTTGSGRDLAVGVLALVLVIGASMGLEVSASELGGAWGIPDLVLGGVIIAAVTSLPNVVAAVYLARRGRGAATLSEAMNSNRINTLFGLLVPTALLGVVATADGGAGGLAVWYVVMTVGVLALAYLRRGISRVSGSAVLLVYAVVVVTLVLSL